MSLSTSNISRRAALALGATCAVSAFTALAGCGSSAGDKAAASTAAASAEASASTTAGTASANTSAESGGVDYSVGTHHATIEVADYGTIKVELYATNAPKTVTNFAKLANEGFYDGLTFHRIIKGFMIQGGDPNGDGTGDSGTTITGEFSSNGHPNPISHERGTISMARSTAPNSASCQFFIMQETNTQLDGNYAAFGHVTSGMDVVDAIANNAKPTDNNGTIPKDQQPVITSIRMDD